MNTIILVILIFSLIFIGLLWTLFIEFRLKRIFAGTKVKNLEEMIVLLGKKMNAIEKEQVEISKHFTTIDSRLDKTIRNVEVIRFNPFLDSGSNQSFAISFMNDENNGVIISSLYARDRMSIFAKPIIGGKSDFELSAEEKEVLKKSISK